MKIQKIRLNNLNSLTGKWELDLTGDAYTVDRIFAITGPTGSGKTTILDAVCLALYGCTPRLKTISKSTNEIMHRRAAECSAEVEIATPNGVYRCTWGQERARGNADGTLQTPHHEIADALTGEIITTRKREVPKRVEELTGMDYDRFTRSVMLAQGDFAAFLNASPDERSPLLEQITGTEVYSEISVAVHLRRREEQDKLDILEAESSGILLLTDEEIITLRDDEAALIQTGKQLQKEIQSCRDGIHWHQEGTRIAGTITETEREEANRTEQQAAAEGRLMRLQKGEKAAEHMGAYRRVTTLREGQEHDTQSLRDLETALPKCKDALNQAETALSLRDEAVIAAQKKAEETAPVLREVRALDLQVQAADNRLRELSSEQERADKDWQRQCSELRRSVQANAITTEEDEASTWYLASHGIAGYPGAVYTRIQSLAKQVADAVPGDTAHPLPTDTATVCDTAAEQGYRLEQELAKIPWYAAPELLREETVACQRKNTDLTLLDERLKDGANDTKQSLELAECIRKKREEATKFRSAQEECNRERGTRERLAEQMDKTARLAARVQTLEEERSHLTEGEPCPLCGATTHPYVTDSATLPRAAEEELRLERIAIAGLRDRESAILSEITRSESEAKSADEALAAIRERAVQREKNWAEGCRRCGLDPDTPDRTETVQAALSTVCETIERCSRAETAIRTLKEQARATTTLISHCREAIQRFHSAEACAARTAKQERDLKDLRDRRCELFGDASPDEAEQQYKQTVREKEAEQNQVREHHQKTVQKMAGLEGEIRTIRDAVVARDTEIHEAERIFKEAVCSAGFYGEEDFAEALLSPEETTSLRNERDRLNQWQAALAVQYATALKDAEAHRCRRQTEKDETTLTEELHSLTTAEQENNTRRGEIRQQLKRQEDETTRYAGQKAQIAAQQAETDRWNELHALIGSADGKKFRNFAQGLTFEVMIVSANRQLQAMNDRYILIPDPEKPLELAVRDNYQGGTVRSTRNLSGGESFLVSLALALGLASMASGKIQVDSLFLDEGFGTLDGDALEMALSTLSSLRDQGKLIGVISHVPALKERIGTVIQVTKKSGGRSVIDGPGVIRY